MYDGRAELAKPPVGGERGERVGGVALRPPSAAVTSPAQLRSKSRGASRGVVREGVTTAIVPGDAVNENLCLQPDLRAVGGWRGPYSLALQRDSKDFGIAMRVIDVGMQMAQERRL